MYMCLTFLSFAHTNILFKVFLYKAVVGKQLLKKRENSFYNKN